MKEVRQKALALRLQGFSYNEINQKLGVPKSTLSGWFSELVLSDKAKNRLENRKGRGAAALVKRNKQQTQKAQERAKKNFNQGKLSIKNLSKHDLLLVGVSLYWGEGYKRLAKRNGREITGHTISFVNADPEMMRIFIQFLVEVLEVPKDSIKAVMRLYPHINEDEARKFWIKESTLPASSFYRQTIYLVSGASKRKKPFNRLTFGTLQIEVADTAKFHMLMGMIEGVKIGF